jgi:hypothetical protein
MYTLQNPGIQNGNTMDQIELSAFALPAYSRGKGTALPKSKKRSIWRVQ